MLRVAVLASGRGSNFSALLAASRAPDANFTVVGLYSDQANAHALRIARDSGLDAAALDHRQHTDRTAFDTAFFLRVMQVQPDLIVCAGYMRIISPTALAELPIPMINIHPSLLPLYPGLHTHARALAAGDSAHGVSVHVVTAELDAGPIIAQARINVHADDTTESLAERVLECEHRLLPACVSLIATGRMNLGPDEVLLDGAPLRSPLQLRGKQLFQEQMT